MRIKISRINIQKIIGKIIQNKSRQIMTNNVLLIYGIKWRKRKGDNPLRRLAVQSGAVNPFTARFPKSIEEVFHNDI